MQDQAKRNNRGFTLIELLIVVVIIGILAAIAIPKFTSTREKAFVSAMKSDLRNMQSAQEIYFSDNFSYAGTLAALGFAASDGVTVTFGGANATGWAASAAHSGTTQGCAVFVGDATPVSPSTASDQGKVVCSAPATP